MYVKDTDKPLCHVPETDLIDVRPSTSSYQPPMSDRLVALHILSPEHIPATVTPAEGARYVILGPGSFSPLQYSVAETFTSH